MKVTVYTTKAGKDHKEGTISWDGKNYVLEPSDSKLLESVLIDVIPTADGLVNADDADKFLPALNGYYRSAYLRVSGVEGDDSGIKPSVKPSPFRDR